MFPIIYFILSILQSISFTHGQYVQTMPPQDLCVSSSITLRCPTNYGIVVRNAFYGVARTAGSCTYSTGDCIADAMTLVTCSTDSVPCVIYATRKKLPQCREQNNDYLHIEYDCVPISMNDLTKEYDICQDTGTDITDDHGIIKSPGYPTQFQGTSSECIRVLRARHDQTIRVWLSDLSIYSSAVACTKDYIVVVDSIQTYRYCGRKQYAYPYLCSSTILIIYMANTTQLSTYRGMRMYFEIVDRPANDTCPNSHRTTTIDHNTTAITPVYDVLGTASPIQSVQLCKGESRTIECPNNYVVAIITNKFGVTPNNQCEPHDAMKHCTITTASTLTCQQRCMHMYTGNRVLPSCNNTVATYQYIKYQCIPTDAALVSSNISCPTDGSKVPIEITHRARFQSYQYPNLQRMNCTYRFKTQPDSIMHIYSLDISLNGFSSDCRSNKITFVEDGDNQGTEFCEQRTLALIYSSCSNELDLHYMINDDTQILSSGVHLYIESQLRPMNWSCGRPLTSLSNSTTPTSLTNESFMIALDVIEHDICFGDSLSFSCPSGYTFMILDAFYGLKKQVSNECRFTPGDCIQEAFSTVTQCQDDTPNCYLLHSSKHRLIHCSDNYANYLHIRSQCVPSRSVQNESIIKTYDVCQSNTTITDVNGIVTSPNFPLYTRTDDECRRTILGIRDRVLKIWINELSLPSDEQHRLDDDSNTPDLIIYRDHHRNDFEEMYPSIRAACIKDYLMISSPRIIYVYCGKRKLVMPPICAPSVVIQYKSISPPNLLYRGFKFYFEWIEKAPEILCSNDSLVSTSTLANKPLPSWAENLEVSPILSAQICLGTSITLECPRQSDYVLSIVRSNYGVTSTGLCEAPSASHCQQEVSLHSACTQSCFIEYIIPKPLVQCGSQNADYLSINYECIPTRLPNNQNTIDICASTTMDTIIAMNTGMMISPQYPVLSAADTCSKRIETLPSKLWMIFIVDLYVQEAGSVGHCNVTSLTIDDSNTRIVRCGLQQPELILVSCSHIVDLTFVSTHQTHGYRGFKVYFKTVDAFAGWACPPKNSSTTTTTTLQHATTKASTLSSTISPRPTSTTLNSTSTSIFTTLSATSTLSPLLINTTSNSIPISVSTTQPSTISVTTPTSPNPSILTTITTGKSMAIGHLPTDHILMLFCAIVATLMFK